MIKVIVSDLDGTLFYGHGETVFDITERNIEALNKAKEAGINFFIASGRMLSYSKYLYDQFGFDNQIMAGFNGAAIYDNGDTPISYPVDKEVIKDVLTLIDEDWKTHGYLQIQTIDNIRLFSHNDHYDMETYQKEMDVSHTCHIDLEHTIQDYIDGTIDITPMKLSIVSKDASYNEPLYKRIKEEYGERCYITMSNPNCLEVMNPLANKGIFIQYLKNTYQYRPYEIAVIGDSLNDIDMFPYCENCFAMENGADELKERAQYIVNDVAQCIELCIKLNTVEKE